MMASKREWNRKQLAVFLSPSWCALNILQRQEVESLNSESVRHSLLVLYIHSAKNFKLSLSFWWTKAPINFMHFHTAIILLKTPSHINIAFFFFNLIWENTHKNPSLTKYFTEQSTCQIKVVFKLNFKLAQKSNIQD